MNKRGEDGNSTNTLITTLIVVMVIVVVIVAAIRFGWLDYLRNLPNHNTTKPDTSLERDVVIVGENVRITVDDGMGRCRILKNNHPETVWLPGYALEKGKLVFVSPDGSVKSEEQLGVASDSQIYKRAIYEALLKNVKFKFYIDGKDQGGDGVTLSTHRLYFYLYASSGFKEGWYAYRYSRVSGDEGFRFFYSSVFDPTNINDIRSPDSSDWKNPKWAQIKNAEETAKLQKALDESLPKININGKDYTSFISFSDRPNIVMNANLLAVNMGGDAYAIDGGNLVSAHLRNWFYYNADPVAKDLSWGLGFRDFSGVDRYLYDIDLTKTSSFENPKSDFDTSYWNALKSMKMVKDDLIKVCLK